ncbi:MAG: Photosynthesis system assembly factor, partial [Pseudonocardiales bacterium]|nr:Photosynthesis system assembly factor [Pseudonocardiales bacterium]
TSLLLAGCASSGGGQLPDGAQSSPLPAAAPYLEMTKPNSGIAVWPSGSAWVLLSTSDGFGHVTNRTPQAVETDGGLVAAVAAGNATVAVRPHEQLVRSPVLTADGTWQWDAGELPGAVADSRAALSVVPDSAVITSGHGTLERRTAHGWTAAVSAARLAQGLTLDAVTWASGRIGWLTGSADGTATAYGTRDGGATWTPVAHTAGSMTATLPACGSGSSWILPVIRSGTSMVVLRTSDSGAHWTAGSSVALGSAGPVVGCARDVVWLEALRRDQDRILSSSDDGATWSDRGVAPGDLRGLTPTGGGAGFATSGGSHPTLWRVSDDGGRFSRITLPAWVAALGHQGSGS